MTESRNNDCIPYGYMVPSVGFRFAISIYIAYWHWSSCFCSNIVLKRRVASMWSNLVIANPELIIFASRSLTCNPSEIVPNHLGFGWNPNELGTTAICTLFPMLFFRCATAVAIDRFGLFRTVFVNNNQPLAAMGTPESRHIVLGLAHWRNLRQGSLWIQSPTSLPPPRGNEEMIGFLLFFVHVLWQVGEVLIFRNERRVNGNDDGKNIP